MKKGLLPLMLILVLLFPACSQVDQTVTAASESEIIMLKQNAETLADNLINGNYDKATIDFNDKMLKALKGDGLKNAWLESVTNIGEHKNRISTEYAYDKGYNVVIVQEAYETSALNIRVVYGAKNKVVGLFFTYAALPKVDIQSELFTENPVIVAGRPDLPLDGVLTLPVGVDKPAVVILVQGSGQSDKDETIFVNRPFADIAHGLAEKGIATLRYDKRYFRYPDKATAAIRVEDEILEDVFAAIDVMKNDDRVDSQRIYVLGHSLGGCMTPAIAAINPDLAGIISMAGSLRPLFEISYDQNQELIRNIDRNTLTKEQNQLLDEQIAQIEKDIAILRGDMENIPDDTILLGLPAVYYKSVKNNSGIVFIDMVKCPILVLQGSADFQVYPDVDYVLWEEKLAGRNNVTFRLYDNLNHLMMTTNGIRDISDYQTPNKVDQRVIDDIAAFVK